MTAEGREAAAWPTSATPPRNGCKSELGRQTTVTVRADDLAECIGEAAAHLGYWSEPHPDWLDRLRAALPPVSD